MQVSDYFEDLEFDSGRKFNVSRTVIADQKGQTHWHPYMEILLSYSDHNLVTVNFNEHHIKSNDLIILYPGDLHGVLPEDEHSMLVFQFSSSLLTVMDELGSLLEASQRHHYIPYDIKDPDCEHRIWLLKKIASVNFSDDPFRETRIYSLLLEFFADVESFWQKSDSEKSDMSSEKDPKASKFMAEICLYISKNCTKHLTLGEVADHFGMSRSYFSHLFSSTTNMTFVGYLTNERIRYAERLCRNPSLSVTNIAFESGFSSIPSFNRAFRKVKGMSPSEFRARMIKSDAPA